MQTYGRQQSNKRRKVDGKGGKGKDWVLKKKDQMRKRGERPAQFEALLLSAGCSRCTPAELSLPGVHVQATPTFHTTPSTQGASASMPFEENAGVVCCSFGCFE